MLLLLLIDLCVMMCDFVDMLLKFVYVWVVFGYVVSSAAFAAMVDVDDFGVSLVVV